MSVDHVATAKTWTKIQTRHFMRVYQHVRHSQAEHTHVWSRPIPQPEWNKIAWHVAWTSAQLLGEPDVVALDELADPPDIPV